MSKCYGKQISPILAEIAEAMWEIDLDNDGDIAKSLTPVRNGITGEPL